MAPKEPTRHQLSSRLQYHGKTPAFLLKLQNKVAGRGSPDAEEDDPQVVADGDVDEFGRERRSAMPSSAPTASSVRPPIPERPADDGGGSEDEDDGDEKPVVVVLKEGKHLTAREAENEKRKAQGLAPLPPEPDMSKIDANASRQTASGQAKALKSGTEPGPGLSFSSSTRGNGANKPSGSKRKTIEENDRSQDTKQQNPKKKPKKTLKGSLSFDQG